MRKEDRLEDAVRAHPQLTEVFNDLGIDYCCGGKDSLEEAAAKKNYEIESFLALLDKELAKVEDQKTGEGEDLKDFESLSLEEMIVSLEKSHHVFEREEMEKLEKDLNKVLLAHYANHRDLLIPLHKTFYQLKADLEEHFAKEEKETFPQMLEGKDPETIEELANLEAEHEGAGDLIKEILQMTDNLSLPEDACPTFERTYREFKGLFEDIYLHIYKENSLLFPKYRKETLA